MNINATILGQILTFSIFIWVNKRFIWPKILKVLHDREQQIVQGLQAAELGQQKLQQAELEAQQRAVETKKYCNLLINEAKKQAEQILELSILQAKNKGNEIIQDAYLHLDQEKSKLQRDLQQNLANLIIQGTQKLITTNLTEEIQEKILQDINNQLYDQQL